MRKWAVIRVWVLHGDTLKQREAQRGVAMRGELGECLEKFFVGIRQDERCG